MAGEQKFTPGPWSVIEDHEISVDGESWEPSYMVTGWKILGNPEKPGMAIAVIDMGFPNTWDDATNDANASLIAAAPELLAALELASTHIGHMAAWIGRQKGGYSFESLGEDMPTITAAIDKARGQ